MIRDMTAQDLDAVEALEKELFKSGAWTRDNFRCELEDNPFAHLIVYEINGEVKGFADYWITYEISQLADIGVAGDVQNRGIGREMLEWMLRKADQEGCENMSLEVRVSNEPAIHLYEKFGFIRAGIRKNYYTDGEDAILMVCPLGGKYDEVTGN
jgi:ribosomal-protein-alanine N-acetyltransferase